MADSLSFPKNSCVCPSRFNGSMPLNGALVPLKRGRSVVEEDPATTLTLSPQPPWKRVRRPFESQQKAITAFWDSLSQVSLTRHALKEHNRRNRSAAELYTPAPEKPSDLGKGVGDHIKRFARHGGPNLGDLRGVSMVLLSTELMSLTLSSSAPRTHCSTAQHSRDATKSVHFEDQDQVYGHPRRVYLEDKYQEVFRL